MKDFTTGYIIIDHLLLKEFIIYYLIIIQKSILIEELINESNIKIEKDSPLTEIADSLKKSTGLVVRKLRT